MMRALVLISIAACATATAEHRAGDGGTSEGDAADHRDAEVTQHDGSASGSASGSGSGCSFTGDLATWDLTGQTGSEVAVVAGMTANGVTAGALTRSGGINASTGIGSINSTNWPSQATLDNAKYYKFTVAAPTGCTITITGLSIDLKASGTGPVMGSLATSVDAFAATMTASTTAPSTPTLTVSSTSGIELHVYGFSATSAGGTLRIQNLLVVRGSLE
ncbi:hypothetical protein BH11MYX1_BH11MYX1_39800 [soil metagenome]